MRGKSATQRPARCCSAVRARHARGRARAAKEREGGMNAAPAKAACVV